MSDGIKLCEADPKMRNLNEIPRDRGRFLYFCDFYKITKTGFKIVKALFLYGGDQIKAK